MRYPLQAPLHRRAKPSGEFLKCICWCCVGESGMGAYHGKDGFDAFSHYKSVMDKKTWLDLPMRYQPYKSKLYKKLLHMFLK